MRNQQSEVGARSAAGAGVAGTPGAAPFIHFASAGWRGVVRAGWDELLGADPLERVEAARHEVVKRRPHARTLRLWLDGWPLYAKHTTGLTSGVGRSWPGRAVLRAKWLLWTSRALHTQRISGKLAEHGLRAPAVVLAVRRRRGCAADDLLITGAAEGQPLCVLAPREVGEADPGGALDLAGRRLADLHRAGFLHGDALPGNLLVTPDRRDIVFLDNDRTRHWGPLLRAASRRRNLEQMTFRLVHQLPYRLARRFLRAYLDAWGIGGPRRRRLQRGVLEAVRARSRSMGRPRHRPRSR